MPGWTARSLADHTDVPPSTVSHWITSDLVHPEEYGRGRAGHTIGVYGLFEILAIKELRNAGFSLQAIRKTVEHLQTLSGADRPLAELTLVVVGQDIIWKNASDLTNEKVSALQEPGQRLMVFPVGEKHSKLLTQLQAEESQPA